MEFKAKTSILKTASSGAFDRNRTYKHEQSNLVDTLLNTQEDLNRLLTNKGRSYSVNLENDKSLHLERLNTKTPSNRSNKDREHIDNQTTITASKHHSILRKHLPNQPFSTPTNNLSYIKPEKYTHEQIQKEPTKTSKNEAVLPMQHTSSTKTSVELMSDLNRRFEQQQAYWNGLRDSRHGIKTIHQ